MTTAWLLLVALTGCKKDEPGDTGPSTTTPVIDCSVKTETYPQFCGSVPDNLMFISIDTFRKDLLHRYGGDLETTPTLDRLATEGVVLDDNVQAANWTFHSTTATLMGQTPENAGFAPRLAGAEPFPTGIDTLPGILAEQGYWSVLASSNAWLSNTWGNGRDFNQVIYPAGGKFTGVADRALGALATAQNLGIADKWFVHAHALETHAPYNPDEVYLAGLAELDPIPWNLADQNDHYATAGLWPVLDPQEQELLLAHMQVRYHGEARSTDDGIQQVLDRMDAAGLLDDTLVVIWTDHGEQFWEHEYQTHAHQLYGEENDALAIFWAKNIVPAVHTGPTQSTDIVPTLLSLYGLPVPPDLDGIPLGAAPEDRVRFTTSDARRGPIQAVLSDGWKLQFYWWGGELILTNPGADPTEAPLDLAANSAKVDELWTLLEPRAQLLEDIKGFGPDQWPTLP